MLMAATSWARAAISGLENVPSQMRDFLRGSRISDTHLPQFRIRTPRYIGCLLPSLCLFDTPASCVFRDEAEAQTEGEGEGEEAEREELLQLSTSELFSSMDIDENDGPV